MSNEADFKHIISLNYLVHLENIIITDTEKEIIINMFKMNKLYIDYTYKNKQYIQLIKAGGVLIEKDIIDKYKQKTFINFLFDNQEHFIKYDKNLFETFEELDITNKNTANTTKFLLIPFIFLDTSLSELYKMVNTA